MEGVREAGWPVWRQEESGLLLYRCAFHSFISEMRPIFRSNASSSGAVGQSLGSEAIHIENRGEGCPHILTSAWRVAGGGRLNEDFTLKARWVDLTQGTKILLRPILIGPFKPKQTNVKCAGVRLGRVAWRCVDQMLTATHRLEGVSATPARKEIRKTAVSLG